MSSYLEKSRGWSKTVTWVDSFLDRKQEMFYMPKYVSSYLRLELAISEHISANYLIMEIVYLQHWTLWYILWELAFKGAATNVLLSNLEKLDKVYCHTHFVADLKCSLFAFYPCISKCAAYIQLLMQVDLQKKSCLV